ncbi:MAG: GNAT family N-acetyltransferase [Anaerolineae bacterium]|nr:GNAT family N-acetyltransferase [Anaerolineae bacterium]
MSITIETINTTEAFKNLRKEWNRLLEQSPVQSIFLTWEWLYTWWDHFGADKTLHILLARDSSEIVGIAPLMITTAKRLGFRFRMLRNLGMPDVDVAGLIVKDGDQEVVNHFCQEIQNASRQWDILELGEFPNAVLDPQTIVRQFHEANYLSRLMPKLHTFIPTTGNWEDYYKTLAKHHRRSMRRKERLLAEEHKSVEYQRFNEGKVRPEHYNIIFNINAKARFPELYATESLRNFHLALAKPDVLQHAVDISFFLVNNVPIAFDYGFLYNQVYEAWRGAYTPRCSEYSPGSLIFLKLLNHNFTSGYLGVDLLRGEHDYKKRWRGYDRPFTLLWVVPRRKVLACAAYIWLPDLKKRVVSLLKRRNADSRDAEGED